MKKTSAIDCFKVISKRDRYKVVTLLFVQLTLSILDLLGVITIGLLGALSVTGLQSGIPTGRVASLINLIGLESLAFQAQAAIIASTASLLLIIRTIASIYLTRRSLYFLSNQGSRISADLYTGILTLPYLKLKTWNSQEIVYAVNAGCNAITVGVVGSSLNFLTDFGLVIILVAGLLAIDISIAISTLLAFTLIASVLYILMQKKSERLSTFNSELVINGNVRIIESLTSFREIFVKNRQDFYGQKVRKNREELAFTTAELSFMPNVSKYVIEISMVIGIFVLGGIQFLLKDAVHAIGTLSVFLAASTRLAPAILRMQQNAITFRSSLAVAKPALDLFSQVRENNLDLKIFKKEGSTPELFDGGISLVSLTFSFPDSDYETISNLSLVINAGEFVAITGPSGAGKTTLVDLILGLIEPTHGDVFISGMRPKRALQYFESQISYVPQDIEVFEGTIRSNITLGFNPSDFTDLEIEAALTKAHLLEFVESLPDGINAEVGERGTRLSGGQRQRLGIARGIVNSPKLLILDEATSALDSETELEVSKTIYSLGGSCTVIVIAHRLSTVQNADKVIYIEGGKLVSSGTFEEVRNQVPNFENQARLMGL